MGVRGTDPLTAYMISRCLGWVQTNTLEDGIEAIYKRVAYACRYGNQSLDEMMHTAHPHMDQFIFQLGEIVEEENKSSET